MAKLVWLMFDLVKSTSRSLQTSACQQMRHLLCPDALSNIVNDLVREGLTQVLGGAACFVASKHGHDLKPVDQRPASTLLLRLGQLLEAECDRRPDSQFSAWAWATYAPLCKATFGASTPQ